MDRSSFYRRKLGRALDYGLPAPSLTLRDRGFGVLRVVHLAHGQVVLKDDFLGDFLCRQVFGYARAVVAVLTTEHDDVLDLLAAQAARIILHKCPLALAVDVVSHTRPGLALDRLRRYN